MFRYDYFFAKLCEADELLAVTTELARWVAERCRRGDFAPSATKWACNRLPNDSRLQVIAYLFKAAPAHD